jgi:hypothetical protein
MVRRLLAALFWALLGIAHLAGADEAGSIELDFH